MTFTRLSLSATACFSKNLWHSTAKLAFLLEKWRIRDLLSLNLRPSVSKHPR